MGQLTLSETKTILAYHGTPVDVFIETGTHLGTTFFPLCEAKLFRAVHTIELSPTYFDQALQRTKNLPGFGRDIVLHRGDSAEVMKTLVPSLHEPIFFWLDAHWYPDPHAACESPCPLFLELATIATHPHADIIAIDDVHCFGRKWDDGPGADWTDIYEDTILRLLDRRVRESYVHTNKLIIHLRAA